LKDSIADNIHHLGFKRLLLAVSGGLDSICLAHYFIANREALGIEWLGIAHVHHGLREGTADRDAAFVEAFAKAHGVPFFLKRLDGESLKNAEGSLEENARDARYKALIEVFNETGDPPHTGTMRTKQQVAKCCPPVLRGDDNKGIIVTAHHAGDQAETMYMRLRRGTTLAGLRGIQEIRVLSNSQSVASPTQEDTSYCLLSTSYYIFRPFLSVTRAELFAYARENNLTWCEDESNSDTKFARNFIRHEALPHLERNCPGATRQLCRIAGLADKAYAKVMEKCNELFREALRQTQGNAPKEDFSIDCFVANASRNDIIPLKSIRLNQKALRKIFLANADADLSEMFRLWLSAQGFRFPIGFFFNPKEPAHVKIPVHTAYRKRSIVKKGHTVIICEFESAESALKFVSCGLR
jgi:tRNA(Ile)-lysidine synthase